MPISRFIHYFENKNEFEDFKARNVDFVKRLENMASILVSQGMSQAHANQIIYERMYHPFLKAKNFYDLYKR